MKFPSIDYLVMQAGASFKRFYLALFYAVIGTFAGLALIEQPDQPSFLVRLLYTSSLGIPAAIGAVLFAERSPNRDMKWFAPAAVLFFTTCYYFFLAPSSYFNNYHATLVYYVLAIVLHFWVAISGYLIVNEKTGFWRFNETLYSRLLLSLFFSVTLYAGLALAIFACKVLLRFEFDYKIYGKLWIFIIGIFNTWFFLAGAPRDFEEVNTEKEFPKSLKIFTQYILIPTVTLYMAILYLYSVKIVSSLSLPKGWVSMLIMCYSVLGILAILLVSPLRDKAEMAWVRLFSRFFFIASLPLIILLYTAVTARVGAYGITEERYYLLVIAGWLTFISIYFIFSRQKNIRIVPLSLVIIGILSLFGPWGAISVSERSQRHRLEKILLNYKIWKPGQRVTTSDTTMNEGDRRQAYEVISYFARRNDLVAIQEIFAVNLSEFGNDRRLSLDNYAGYAANRNAGEVAMLMNALNKPQKDTASAAREAIRNRQQLLAQRGTPPERYFGSDLRKGFNVAGFSKICPYTLAHDDTKQYIYLSPADSVNINVTTTQDTLAFLEFTREGKVIETFSLNEMIQALKQKPEANQQYTPVAEMTLSSSRNSRFRVIVKSIQFRNYTPPAGVKSKLISHLEVWILVR